MIVQRRNSSGNGTGDALRFSELAVALNSHSQTAALNTLRTGGGSAFLRDDFPILYALYKLADRAAFRTAANTTASTSFSAVRNGTAATAIGQLSATAVCVCVGVPFDPMVSRLFSRRFAFSFVCGLCARAVYWQYRSRSARHPNVQYDWWCRYWHWRKELKTQT